MEQASYGTLKQPRGVIVGILTLFLGLGLSACPTETDVGKPAEARILIDGTAAEPMELVTATDFIEMIDPIQQDREYVLLDADTLMIEPPYDRTVDITTLGSIFFQL